MMTYPQILIDSSFLFALLDENNADYALAQKTFDTTSGRGIIPYVVLTETAYLFGRTGGVPALLRFYDNLIGLNLPFEGVFLDDLRRARHITAQYADAKLDFVDTCLMAIAERLKVETICTFDRRDFLIFRPQHCEYLQVLP